MVGAFDHANIARPKAPGLTPTEAFKKDLLLQITHEWRSSEALASTRAELAANRVEARRRRLAERAVGRKRWFRMIANQKNRNRAAAEKDRKLRSAKLAPGLVMRAVLVAARAYKVTPMEMLGLTKQHHVAEARCAAWHRAFVKAAKRGTPMSLPQIGRIVARDHTTILYGIRRHCERHDLPCPPGLSEWRADRDQTRGGRAQEARRPEGPTGKQKSPDRDQTRGEEGQSPDREVN